MSLVVKRLTAAGSGASPGGAVQARRSQLPCVRGPPRSVRILVSARSCPVPTASSNSIECGICLPVFVRLSNLFSVPLWLFSSYLAGRDELQRAQSGLHVGDVALELIEGSGDLLLRLIGLLARGAVGRDLDENAVLDQCSSHDVCQSRRKSW